MAPDKPIVAITRYIPPAGTAALEGKVNIRQRPDKYAPPRDELIRLLQGADAALVQLSDRIDGELLDACPMLKIVANMAVGYENVDHAAAAQRGVWVSNTPDVLTDATADLTLAIILAITRRIVETDGYMRQGAFKQWEPMLWLGSGLQGKVLGIVGYGRIGRAVAARARAFGMSIVYHDPGVSPAGDDRGLDLDELLATADIVSLHCPYKPELHHLIGARALSLMKPTAFFVNAARGKLHDEQALCTALKEGRIAGAALDVYENEPAFVAGLAELKNVVMVPHIGSATLETRNAMAALAANNILAVLGGGEPLTPVNKPAQGK